MVLPARSGPRPSPLPQQVGAVRAALRWAVPSWGRQSTWCWHSFLSSLPLLTAGDHHAQPPTPKSWQASPAARLHGGSGAGPGVPCAPMPSMDMEPDPAGPYSQPHGDGQSWPGPVPGLLRPPCPQAPHPVLPLLAWQRNELCPQRCLCSPAWAAARPQCRGAPMAAQPAGHHAHATRQPFPALLPGRAQGASPCLQATWHLGSQGGAARPPAQPGTAPWLCWAQLCPEPHSFPSFSETWGLQCHNVPACAAGCPPTQGLDVERSRGGRPACLAGGPSCLRGLPGPPCTRWSTRV